MTAEQSPQTDDVSGAAPGDASEPGEVVLYDPELASLRLTTGGREISVAGLAGELVFERMAGEAPPQWALFATVEELEVLAKMVAYILEKVKISEASKVSLSALLPRVEQLREKAQAVALVG